MNLKLHLTSADKIATVQKLSRIRTPITLLVLVAMLSLLLAASASQVTDRQDQVRQFTRTLEFDYLSWTGKALVGKLGQFALGAPGYLAEEQRGEVVQDYLRLVDESRRLQGELQRTLADPSLKDPLEAAGPMSAQLGAVRSELESIQPLAETVLQENVTAALEDLGFGLGGSLFPPVAFQISELPVALIVSPRDVIRQDANIQLTPGLDLEDRVMLEAAVEQDLDVSALIVGIGGLSTYPTMLMESTSVEWLAETIVHEWVHHYLALRPLGLGYETSGETRTINETVAGIVGREIGREILARYYPEHLPEPAPEPLPTPEAQDPEQPPEPPAFDFQAEMHETRVRADELLADGRIEDAEEYMEARRQVFWDNGYHHIRRLNQAYFAFHGAYADAPGGAAGADPVGEAVRQVWAQTNDPVEFLRQMAWVTTLEQVQDLLES